MIIRTEARIKQTGEVFTPLPLVDEILNKLPSEVFTDPTKTVIDPACGDGNFLVRVVDKKIQNGSSRVKALNTTFGVDLMSDNVKLCRARLICAVWDIAEEHQGLDIIHELVKLHDTLDDEFPPGKGQIIGIADQCGFKYNHVVSILDFCIDSFDIVKHNIRCGDSLDKDRWPFGDDFKQLTY